MKEILKKMQQKTGIDGVKTLVLLSKIQKGRIKMSWFKKKIENKNGWVKVPDKCSELEKSINL